MHSVILQGQGDINAYLADDEIYNFIINGTPLSVDIEDEDLKDWYEECLKSNSSTPENDRALFATHVAGKIFFEMDEFNSHINENNITIKHTFTGSIY